MSASTGRTPLASRLFAAGSGSTIRNDLTPRWEAGRRWRPCKQRWWELHLVSGSGGRGVDYKVGEGRRGLAEFPPPPHPRLHVRHVSSIDERDACDAVHDCHPVRLVEQLQPLTVPAFPPGALNQLVERWRGEPALVRAAVRLK